MSKIMFKLSVATVALLGLAVGTALADSVKVDGIGLDGAFGGMKGLHTIVIDGNACKVKNSNYGWFPNGIATGCNYTFGDGLKIIKSEQGCSKTCEQ